MHIIKLDIAKLNKQIAQLQIMVKELNANSPHNCRQAMEHNSNVVVLLQSRLAAQTSTFKDVLELRTENMKATKDRREQFMFTAQQQSNTFASMYLSREQKKNAYQVENGDLFCIWAAWDDILNTALFSTCVIHRWLSII